MDLTEQYRQMHRQGYFPGLSSMKFRADIDALILETGAKTFLDYGCGKGDQYDLHGLHDAWPSKPVCYDPAVSVFSRKPGGKFDGVLCIDVLEHLAEEDIGPVLDDIYGYAEKFVFFSVCCRESKKTLPDGRGVHLTIRPEDWWMKKLKGPVRTEVRFTP